MKTFIFTLAALTLVSPTLAQEPPALQQDRQACYLVSQVAGRTDACLDSRPTAAGDETRGNFGDSVRPLSLTEDAWDD